MTITNTKSSITHTGNDATTVWPFDFEIPDLDSIVVELYDVATGSLTETLSPTDFTTEDLGEPEGGSITYPLDGPALPATRQIVISRLVAYTQETSISNQSGFHPQVLEEQFDLTTMQIQQLLDRLDRALVVSPTQEVPDIEDLLTSILNAADNAQLVEDAVASVNLPIIEAGDARKQLFVADDETGYELLAAVTGLYPGMVVPWPFNSLKAGYLWANFETIGNVGSGADHESANYFDAFQNLKDSPWNDGDENWNNGDVVRLPDFREVVIAGSAGMGGPAYTGRLQHVADITTSIGTPTATMSSLDNLTVGMFVLGTDNVPADTQITAINYGSSEVTLSENASVSGQDSARFSLINDPEEAGSIGGTDTHILDVEQLSEFDIDDYKDLDDPGHKHGLSDDFKNNNKGAGGDDTIDFGTGSNRETDSAVTGITLTFDPIGEDQPHSNLPPTLVVDFAVLVSPADIVPNMVTGAPGRAFLPYAFSTETTIEDPTAGYVRIGTLTEDVGQAVISKTDANGADRNDELMQLIASSTLLIRDIENSAFRALHILSEPDGEQGDYIIFDVEQVGSDGTIADDAFIDVMYSKIGNDGTDPGFLYTWETETSAPPSSGCIRANNADLSSATEIYVSDTTRSGSAVAALIQALAPGAKSINNSILFTETEDKEQAGFQVTGVTDESGYTTLAVSSHAGETAFSTGAISLQREISGADGADGEDGEDGEGTGDVVGPGSATDENVALFDGTTGKLIKDGGTVASNVPSATTSAEGKVERATVAEARDPSVDGKFPAVKDLYDAAAEVSLTDAATIALDLDTGIDFHLSLGGNNTLGTPSNATPGKTGCIRVTGDGNTMAFHADWRFGGSPPDTSVGSQTLLFYKITGSNAFFIAGVEDWTATS